MLLKKIFLPLLILPCFLYIHYVAGEEYNWTQLYPQNSPPANGGFGMVYFPDKPQSIMHGGNISQDQNWSYSANNWSLSTDPAASMGYYAPSMALGNNHAIILFGGKGGTTSINYQSDQTWLYDPISLTWSQLFPLNHPPGRNMGAMACDNSGITILFGGAQGNSKLKDTWAYDATANTWTSLTFDNSPPPLAGASLVNESNAGLLILFGGLTSGNVDTNQTWAYSVVNNTWENLTPDNVDDLVSNNQYPTSRYGAGIAFNGTQVILFGGQKSNSVLNDTWSYDYGSNTWTLLSPPSSPPGRSLGGMTYDESSNQVILFGGFTSSGKKLGDTWALAVPPPPPVDVQVYPTESGGVVATHNKDHRMFVDVVNWKAPKRSSSIVSYRVFINKELRNPIDIISADSRLKTKFGHRDPCKFIKYFVVSVDRFGNASKPAVGKLKSSRFCHDHHKKCHMDIDSIDLNKSEIDFE